MKKHLAMPDDLGKENVCPPYLPPIATRKFDSRSPLPLGFRRAPLQDITHILSPLAPLNILPDDAEPPSEGPCRRKRTCDVALSSCGDTSSRWSGLKSCTSVQTIIRVSDEAQQASSEGENNVSDLADDKEALLDVAVVKSDTDREKSVDNVAVDTDATEGEKLRYIAEVKAEAKNADAAEPKSSSDSHVASEVCNEIHLTKKRRQIVSGKVTSSSFTVVTKKSEAKARSNVLKFR